jgi:hypothetical protein
MGYTKRKLKYRVGGSSNRIRINSNNALANPNTPSRPKTPSIEDIPGTPKTPKSISSEEDNQTMNESNLLRLMGEHNADITVKTDNLENENIDELTRKWDRLKLERDQHNSLFDKKLKEFNYKRRGYNDRQMNYFRNLFIESNKLNSPILVRNCLRNITMKYSIHGPSNDLNYKKFKEEDSTKKKCLNHQLMDQWMNAYRSLVMIDKEADDEFYKLNEYLLELDKKITSFNVEIKEVVDKIDKLQTSRPTPKRERMLGGRNSIRMLNRRARHSRARRPKSLLRRPTRS